MRWIGLLLLGAALLVFAGQRRNPSVGPGSGAPGPSADPQPSKRAPARERTPLGRAAELDHGSPFYSPAACEAHLRAHPRAATHKPRIGSWNIRWFPYGTKDGHDPQRRTDLGWLACAIAALEVDVLAVEEIVQDPGGRNALLDLLEQLDKLTGGSWRSELDTCRGSGRQHVGLLFDQKQVTVSEVAEIAALNPGVSACDRSLRPGLGAYLRFRNGPDLSVVAVHLDSGITGRDFGNRGRSLARLSSVAAELEQRTHDADLVVLGDFNTMGCKDCQPEVDAEAEIDGIDTQLRAFALRRVALPESAACTHYQRGHPSVLDHAVVPAAMQELPQNARLEVFGPCRDLECKSAPRGQHPQALERLSDHCPIVLELSSEDRDPKSEPRTKSLIHR